MLLTVALFVSQIPSAFAGQDLGVWNITRYYTPVPGQERYYNGWARNQGSCAIKNLYYIPYGKDGGDYHAEAGMQGQGDIFTTADGTDLHFATPGAVAACPPGYLGKTLHIERIGYVTCRDTGGAIHGKKIDVWAGIGDVGYNKINIMPGGALHVHLKDYALDSDARLADNSCRVPDDVVHPLEVVHRP
jgi:3D (Asp-Asp-Asp) domain-containing protein